MTGLPGDFHAGMPHPRPAWAPAVRVRRQSGRQRPTCDSLAGTGACVGGRTCRRVQAGAAAGLAAAPAARRTRPTPRQRMLPVADFALHAPRSLEEAAATLARYEGEARPIAGGTALVLMIRQGLIAPPAVVRLDRVPNLAAIAVED